MAAKSGFARFAENDSTIDAADLVKLRLSRVVESIISIDTPSAGIILT